MQTKKDFYIQTNSYQGGGELIKKVSDDKLAIPGFKIQFQNVIRNNRKCAYNLLQHSCTWLYLLWIPTVPVLYAFLSTL